MLKTNTNKIRMSIDNNNVTNELNQDTMSEITERAEAKAFARLCMLDIDLEAWKFDLKSGSYGGITRSEVKLMIDGTKKEIKTWNYIHQLILNDESLARTRD